MAISLSKQDRLVLISEFGTLIASGIPISEAINSLLKDAKNNQKKILESLSKDLTEGKSIADSFARFPGAFDPISISLIRAAEQSGTLDTALKDLVLSLRKEIEFDDKVRGALAYPGMIVLVFLGVMIMILTFVMPRISQVFSRLKVDLPLPTKILIAASNLLVNYAPYVIGGLIILIVLLIILYRLWKKQLTNFFLSLPLISNLAREIDFAQFTHGLSLLLTAGIPITEALALCINIVSKKEVAQLIKHCQDEVNAGEPLSDGLKKYSKIVPSTMIRITEAGENSGNLEKSMDELSSYFDGRITNSLKVITTLIEPVMLVVIGILVGGMMLAIVAPIYQMIGQIKAR